MWGGGIVDTGEILYESVTTPRSSVKGQLTASLVEKESEGTYRVLLQNTGARV